MTLPAIPIGARIKDDATGTVGGANWSDAALLVASTVRPAKAAVPRAVEVSAISRVASVRLKRVEGYHSLPAGKSQR
jgi:hypothetical protein